MDYPAMKLGTRNAGIRLDRAKWGMPARLVLYADRDPCAGPGNIPWRIYWAHDLRWPLRVRLYWSMVCDRSVAWTGRDRQLASVEIEWGLGWNRRARIVWRHRRYESVLYSVAIRPESLVNQGPQP